MQRPHHPRSDIISHASLSEMLAFQIEVGDLFQRIDRAQTRVKLKAIYNSDAVAYPDMFGSQIAMSIENAAMSKAIFEDRAFFPEEGYQRPVARENDGAGKPETGVEKNR
jgi:hypothetical protein